MNSTNYSQFLRLYSSKYVNSSSVGLPRDHNKFISRKVQYISDSSISEDDVSTLIHFVILTGSANIGFTSKFLYMYTSFDNLAVSNRFEVGKVVPSYVPEKSGVWSIGAASPELQIEKKYSVKSPLIPSVRKLFRRAGLDFYVDRASFTLNYRFRGVVTRPSWLKENEILIRFFGFPLRITS